MVDAMKRTELFTLLSNVITADAKDIAEKLSACRWCGAVFEKKSARDPRRFCNASCSQKWLLTQPEYRARFYSAERNRKVREATVKRWKERPELREKMRLGMLAMNPMRKAQAVAKMKASLKRIGHKPKIRGGNGTGPTAAEAVLLKAFPAAVNNYAVKTGKKCGSGFPQHYKVDVAFPKLLLAVECDGSSHNSPSRKAQDIKKQGLLAGLGWTVMRFTNRQIINDTNAVLAALSSTVEQIGNAR